MNVNVQKSEQCEVPERLYAQAKKEILDRKTSNVVGWICEFNNGEMGPVWKKDPYTDVIYRELWSSYNIHFPFPLT